MNARQDFMKYKQLNRILGELLQLLDLSQRRPRESTRLDENLPAGQDFHHRAKNTI
ncbi:hypothetical protein MO973_12195 [Paenibacillus sp. TRM 82003]|nr:hypothetical protein [Paenibacillus sp. TRM 82003]